jgi:hypothetical protein
MLFQNEQNTGVSQRERGWYASANSYTFATFSTVKSCNHKPNNTWNQLTETSYALACSARACAAWHEATRSDSFQDRQVLKMSTWVLISHVRLLFGPSTADNPRQLSPSFLLWTFLSVPDRERFCVHVLTSYQIFCLHRVFPAAKVCSGFLWMVLTMGLCP